MNDFNRIELIAARTKEAETLKEMGGYLSQMGVPVGEITIHPLDSDPRIEVWGAFRLTLEECSELAGLLDERTDRYQDIGGDIGRWDDGRKITPQSAEEFEAAVDRLAAEMESRRVNEKTMAARNAREAQRTAPGSPGGKDRYLERACGGGNGEK